jgi:predicted ATPase
MEGKRTIHSIKLKNILSFGSEGQEIELQPLNVLIGPNASGKSNLIEIFRLLRALPSNPAQVIREGWGVSEWLWKGGPPAPSAQIEVQVDNISYRLDFVQVGYQWQISNESLSGRFADRHPTMPRDTSLLANMKGFPNEYPEASLLAETLSSIGIYKEWNTGRFSPIKSPHRPDLPSRSLLEDLSNFGLVFNNLPNQIKLEITKHLSQVYEGVQEVVTQIEGGTVQTYIQENGLSSPTPLARVSDGVLRFLFLLTLLKQPDPPALICIEEPEVGLHPDVIHLVARLLIEASQRTQLIATTHSDPLVSALANEGPPDAVVVCERDKNGTHLRRLDAERLKKWLEKYSLGELWMMGEIGGTRW